MRSNSRDAATGVSVSFSRAKFVKADDSKRLQEVEVGVFHDESHKGIERFQQYGFTSVPVAPDQKQGGKAAEAIIAYLGAHRSHPIVMAIDDRRSRPKNWPEGDAGLWHYKGAFCKHTAQGWVYDAGPEKKPHEIKVGDASVKVEKDKVTLKLDDTVIVLKNHKVFLIDENASDPVMLQSGPSTRIFGVP